MTCQNLHRMRYQPMIYITPWPGGPCGDKESRVDTACDTDFGK